MKSKLKQTHKILLGIIVVLGIVLTVLLIPHKNLCKNVVCADRCSTLNPNILESGVCIRSTGECAYSPSIDGCSAGCSNGVKLDVSDIYSKSVLWWSFDDIVSVNGADRIPDLSSNGLNLGALVNATIISAGKYNSGLECAAGLLTCSVQAKNLNIPANATKLTFSGWYFVKNISGGGTLFSDASQSNSTGYGDGFFWIRYGPGSTYISINYANGSGYGASTGWNNIIEVNKWIHIVITADTNLQQVTLYKNGISLGTQATVGMKPFASRGKTLYVGDYANNHWYNYTGTMDNVAIFNDVLNAAQVKNLYNSNVEKYSNGAITYTCKE